MRKIIAGACALALMSLIITGGTARAFVDSGGGGSTTFTYYGAPYTAAWTDGVGFYYISDSYGNIAITGQNQGGCLNNASELPGSLQAVSGRVTYYWHTGSRYANSTTLNQHQVTCGYDESVWGSGDTSNDPYVTWLVSDSPGTDYVRVSSQWTCTSCLPSYASESHVDYWN